MELVAPSVEWEACSRSSGCRGVAIPEGNGGCLVHASPTSRKLAFQHIARDHRFDARGVAFDAELWQAVLDRIGEAGSLTALRIDDAELPAGAGFAGSVAGETSADGARFGPDFDCRGAQFTGPVWFRGASFAGAADFSDCGFAGGVEFRAAEFAGDASFVRAHFGRGEGELGGARFHGAAFHGGADFREARFDARAGFRGVRFLGAARFGAEQAAVKTSRRVRPASFGGFTSFDDAVFAQGTSFVGVSFEQAPVFAGASFGAEPEPDAAEEWLRPRVGFHAAAFPAGAGFDGATFRVPAAFSSARFGGFASFAGTTFLDDADFSSASFATGGFAGARFLGEADFARARFAEADFTAVSFGVQATFDDSVHEGEASFGEARFEDEASFLRADLQGGAAFTSARFSGRAHFGGPADESPDPAFVGALFGDAVTFRGATFAADAAFPGVRFDGEASFADTSFRAAAQFDEARFGARASFDRASLADDLHARGALFEGDAEFREAQLHGAAVHLERTRFKAAARFERAQLNVGSLWLTDASFAQRLVLEVVAGDIWLLRCQFAGGLALRAAGGTISIDEAEFGQPSTVSTATGALERERVISLRGSDVGKLVLADVDLAACRFDGAHNLAGLRIEGTEVFARTPATYRGTRRQAIAEEHEWRRDHPRPLQSKGWYPPACAFPGWIKEPPPLEPHEISAIYRDLRKGREDNKDAPGAADFYYGEMEMRRHSGPPTPWAERMIVTGYWAVSGYALRASRALAWLAVLVCLFAVLFWQFGFQPGAADPSFTRALLFSLESTTSLLRGIDRELTTIGEAMWIVLRIAGPLLFGLAVLSLRGRVKR